MKKIQININVSHLAGSYAIFLLFIASPYSDVSENISVIEEKNFDFSNPPYCISEKRKKLSKYKNETKMKTRMR